MSKRVRSFRLLNHIIRIRYPRSITCPDKGPLRGDCLPDECLLKVSTSDIPDSTIEHTRWHEQVHLMLYMAGREDLYEDEVLVDTLAGYLAQYELSVVRR
jgi:hypothetical protein